MSAKARENNLAQRNNLAQGPVVRQRAAVMYELEIEPAYDVAALT